MDIYDEIKKDHDAVRRAIKAICATENDDAKQRETLFLPLKNALVTHQHVEEAVLYDSLKDVEETRAEALEAINEHHVIDVLVEELSIMPKDSDEWYSKFSVLSELLEHHLKEEETEFFAVARKVIDAPRAEELGRIYRARMEAGLKTMQPVA